MKTNIILRASLLSLGFCAMLFSEAQNVGVNTPTPATALDVNGQITVRGGSPGANKVLTSDANGTATWKNASLNTGFFAHKDVTQSISSGVSTAITFPNQYYDAGSNYSTGTSAYTCPTSGFYHFDYQVSFDCINSFTGFKSVGLQITDLGGNFSWKPNTAIQYTTIPQVIHYTFDINLTAGDQVIIKMTQNTGATQNVVLGIFQGYRVY